MTADLSHYLEKLVVNCNRCELHHNGFALERAKGNKSIMVVGEAPGEEEEKTQLPFVGASGHRLDEILKDLNINDYVITNIVKHRPPNNETPTKEIMDKCIQYLLFEIDFYKPKLIILLGQSASYLLKENKSVTELIQDSLSGKYSYNGIPVLVFYHPSYLLRTGATVDKISGILEHYKRVIERCM